MTHEEASGNKRMILTADQERWAEALAVMRQYGGDAPVHVANRIGKLSRAGDQDGMDRWTAIMSRIEQLIRGPVH